MGPRPLSRFNAPDVHLLSTPARKLSAFPDGECVTQERRRMPRYRLGTDITVDDVIGHTLDLSGNGIFFETARPFTPGDNVAVVLPLAYTGPATSVTCTAHVVRVEPRGEYFAVAVAYELVGFDIPPDGAH
jgi:PilZ domain